MADDLVFEVTFPKTGGRFSSSIHVSELEQAIQASFATRGMEVVPGYFEEGNEFYPKNPSFLVLARYKINGNENQLAGGLIATDETIGDFNFKYYDKIFVIPERMGNGVMLSMVRIARQVNSKGRGIMPAVLRTSDEGLDKAYGRLSDISSYEVNHYAGGYYIHGFGFLDKNGREMLEGAKSKFNAAAKYASSKPATAVHIRQDSVYMPLVALEMRLPC